jgi:hypothetical protein
MKGWAAGGETKGTTMDKNPLIGKTLTAFELTNDRKAMRFTLADGEQIEALCDADCCSETWVEHVSLPARGFPAVVLDAADLDMPDLGDMPGRDVVTYYGLKVTTDKGELIVDYRNDSNGYYGGNLSWPGEDHYGGLFGQNVAIREWRGITQDE